ncbi:Phosphatidylglycerophosphatase GEP4, mitochondrial [Hypsizygus marmoreus]|uniref:Phosphatidylglycerophosphatase GEP4, mitochondrial n=1 Tax=Hypsizygus marmoreus TaxID=39966 RepID=A0A369K0M0_HYPMA|nr:Phosphatidylglycerophosphatase GEP4, mitochondrial [Hypsizygus marmoreus]
MPLNVPGLLVPFQLLFSPRLVLPNVIKDIRHIDFAALYQAGYRGAIFDKDNCLARPHKDTIVPEIQDAWQECRKTFGEGNVLIVSNSAGTYLDPGQIQCESVTHNIGVPVLRHKSFKPAYSCITAIRGYFSSLHFPIRDEELVIIGDRVFTDVVMANRMRQRKESQGLVKMALNRGYEDEGGRGREKDTASGGPRGPLAVWTTDVWEKENMALRWCEKRLVDVVRRWTREKDEESQSQFVREPAQHSVSGNWGTAGLFGRLRKS